MSHAPTYARDRVLSIEPNIRELTEEESARLREFADVAKHARPLTLAELADVYDSDDIVDQVVESILAETVPPMPQYDRDPDPFPFDVYGV